METNRRAFVGLGVGAMAVAGMAQSAQAAAAAAKINPLTAPKTRFWIACYTPVDSSGNYDNGANDAWLAYWKSQGADGVLMLGTTGQAQSFSMAERKKIIEQAGKNKHGLDFIVGTGAANLPETIEISRHAADNGADSVLIVPPFYNKNPDGEGVVSYFDAVFAQVKTPVRYYHIPRTTGVPVKPEVLKALAKYPNFVGVKNSNGDAAEHAAITAALPSNLNVVTGTDGLLKASLDNGNGCILASGNLFTKHIAAVFAAKRSAGDVDAAIKKLADAQAAFRAGAGITGGGGEALGKYALALQTKTQGYGVRAPSLPMPDAMKPQVVAGLASLNRFA